MCKSVVTARIVCSAEGKTHMHGRGKGKWTICERMGAVLVAGLTNGICE